MLMIGWLDEYTVRDPLTCRWSAAYTAHVAIWVITPTPDEEARAKAHLKTQGYMGLVFEVDTKTLPTTDLFDWARTHVARTLKPAHPVYDRDHTLLYTPEV